MYDWAAPLSSTAASSGNLQLAHCHSYFFGTVLLKKKPLTKKLQKAGIQMH
jgi:hypothetical protein